MRHLTTLGFIAAAFLPLSLSAQAVSARVLHFETAEPVPGARILLVDSMGVIRANAVSDSTGAVALGAPFTGVFSLRLQHIGWQFVLEPKVALGATDVVEFDLLVKEADVVLDPITVTAEAAVTPGLRGFYERRAAGRGVFITAEDIEKRNPTRIPHALSMIPGIRLYTLDGAHMTVRTTAGRARLSGAGREQRGSAGVPGCPPVVYVDGTLVGNADDVLDNFVYPSEVGGIEVYRRVSELPAAFSGSQAACGVIVIWTKRGPPSRPPSRDGTS